MGGQTCGGAAHPAPSHTFRCWPLIIALPSTPAVSEFFNASCVPVNNPKNYPSSLCALCVGDEQGRNKCVGNSQERYYGYRGAFRYPGGLAVWGCVQRLGPSCRRLPCPLCGRCLVENAGDVAFVRHTTVFDNTNGRWGPEQGQR